MGIDINKLGKLVEEKGVDQSEASAGGDFAFEVPNAGIVYIRLIEYIELGKYDEVYKDRKTGKENAKTSEKVRLGFELRGPNHPEKNEETKREKPLIIRETLTLSTNEKSNFYKLFLKMRQACSMPDAKHMVQLMDKPMKAVIYHNKGKGENADKTYANLKEDGVYAFTRPVRITENEDGSTTEHPVKVPAAINPQRAFIWDLADKEQWDSLFIDGKYDDRVNDKGETVPGKSKNWMQEGIKRAKNWKGSPAAAIAGGADELDVGDAEQPDRDPLEVDQSKDTRSSKGGATESYDLNDDIPF